MGGLRAQENIAHSKQSKKCLILRETRRNPFILIIMIETQAIELHSEYTQLVTIR